MRRKSSLTFFVLAISLTLGAAGDGRCDEAAGQSPAPRVPPKTQGVAPATQPLEAPKPAVTILGSHQAQSVLGKEVRSAADEDMGHIVDIVVDSAGQVRAAVIDFGGFLGVGSRKIAVDWNALHFHAASGNQDLVTLELTRDQVKAAPEYKDKQSVVVLGASGGLQSLGPE